MSAEAGFLQALQDDPADLTTRLVFADWLDDRDDPRGEFLRIQTTLADWVPDLERRTDLQQRQQQLLEQHEADWLGPLRDAIEGHFWENGLVHISLNPGQFVDLEANRDLQTWLPHALVGSVRIVPVPGALQAIAPLEVFGGVRSFDLSGHDLNNHDLEVLLRCRWLREATRLNLSNNRLTSSCLHTWNDSGVLPRLVHLDLRNNRLDDLGLQTLMGWPTARRLNSFAIFGNDCEARTLQLVADWCRERGVGRDRFVNSVGMEFRRIPPGTFLMGAPETEDGRFSDEGPQHRVTLTRPFFLGVCAVTQRQFQQIMGQNPSSFTAPERAWLHPVEQVSWEESVEFCRRLLELPPEKKARRVYRLPGEAEWEHACRAGTTTPLPHPHYQALSSHLANFDGNRPYGNAPVGPFLSGTAPVGSYPPTSFGLFDMLGNTWEWCQDVKAEYQSAPLTDPAPATGSESPVCRGASWYSPGYYLRCADRGSDGTHVQSYYYGFRVACDVG